MTREAAGLEQLQSQETDLPALLNSICHAKQSHYVSRLFRSTSGPHYKEHRIRLGLNSCLQI